jgi:hypothetical protein
LNAFIKLHRFSTGRRIVAMRKVDAVARQRGDGDIEAHLQRGLAHDQVTRRYDLQWAGRPRGVVPIRPIDIVADNILTALRDAVVNLKRVAPPGDPLLQVAAAFLERIYPGGLTTVTQAQAPEQLAAMETIVELLQGELAADVEQLAVGIYARHLFAVVPRYREAVEGSKERLRYKDVEAQRKRGQEYLEETVAMILGTYHRHDDAEHARARAELLAPIVEQNEAIRQYLRRRRRVVDIDPDTGEPEVVAGGGDDDAADDGPEPVLSAPEEDAGA